MCLCQRNKALTVPYASITLTVHLKSHLGLTQLLQIGDLIIGCTVLSGRVHA